MLSLRYCGHYSNVAYDRFFKNQAGLSVNMGTVHNFLSNLNTAHHEVLTVFQININNNS